MCACCVHVGALSSDFDPFWQPELSQLAEHSPCPVVSGRRLFSVGGHVVQAQRGANHVIRSINTNLVLRVVRHHQHRQQDLQTAGVTGAARGVGLPQHSSSQQLVAAPRPPSNEHQLQQLQTLEHLWRTFVVSRRALMHVHIYVWPYVCMGTISTYLPTYSSTYVLYVRTYVRSLTRNGLL